MTLICDWFSIKTARNVKATIENRTSYCAVFSSNTHSESPSSLGDSDNDRWIRWTQALWTLLLLPPPFCAMNLPSLTVFINASSLIQPSPASLFSLHLLCLGAALWSHVISLLFITLRCPDNVSHHACAVMLPCFCPASLAPLFLQLFFFPIIVNLCIFFLWPDTHPLSTHSHTHPWTSIFVRTFISMTYYPAIYPNPHHPS